MRSRTICGAASTWYRVSSRSTSIVSMRRPPSLEDLTGPAEPFSSPAGLAWAAAISCPGGCLWKPRAQSRGLSQHSTVWSVAAIVSCGAVGSHFIAPHDARVLLIPPWSPCAPSLEALLSFAQRHLARVSNPVSPSAPSPPGPYWTALSALLVARVTCAVKVP